ncbi:helix-turn-helix transcriptional regulator [Spirosoma flavum]|uniref:Helix-turn-helix transcriptional regulator n=1 Tax=Spirosoma flavum TaxID=2048557 RepID=A0ABW6AM72_9BACT
MNPFIVMTFYHQQIIKIKEKIYAKNYLYKQVILAKIFIDNHFDNTICIDDMAVEACFSKFHFIRLFTNVYGLTPHQYLTMVRIDKAKKLLHTDKPIKEVCFSVGFSSTSSFTGLFKKITGSTPSEFRGRTNERQQDCMKAV